MQDTEFINYVNSTMSEVNDMTDELYESLIDNDCESVKQITLKMIKTLRDIYKSHE